MRALPISLALVPCLVHAQVKPLNDTGQDKCLSGGTLVACTIANTGDTAPEPRQDGRYGRDARNTAGTLAKTGGGAAGFDFTKVCMDGTLDCAGAADTSSDTPTPDKWACTRDNVTGRVWSLQNIPNVTWAGVATAANPANTAVRCGFSDWRVPSRRELLSIVDFGASNPAIDVGYFPNTDSGSYWTNDSYVPISTYAWSVDFIDGVASAFSQSYDFPVRLVRGGQ